MADHSSLSRFLLCSPVDRGGGREGGGERVVGEGLVGE